MCATVRPLPLGNYHRILQREGRATFSTGQARRRAKAERGAQGTGGAAGTPGPGPLLEPVSPLAALLPSGCTTQRGPEQGLGLSAQREMPGGCGAGSSRVQGARSSRSSGCIQGWTLTSGLAGCPEWGGIRPGLRLSLGLPLRRPRWVEDAARTQHGHCAHPASNGPPGPGAQQG